METAASREGDAPEQVTTLVPDRFKLSGSPLTEAAHEGVASPRQNTSRSASPTGAAALLDDENFLPIKPLNPHTFESIENGLVRRRDAIYQANMRATRALEPLVSMPPLLKHPRRNNTGKLLPPIECDCTDLERDDLSCVLWQEERREVWMAQQVKMCSALLRRAAVVLSAMQKKDNIRIRSAPALKPPGGARGGRRASLKKASFIRTSIEKRRTERSLLRPFRVARNVLVSYFSVNSRDAKQDQVSQLDRVAKLDKPLAGLFCLFCIGPGFLLVYHRVEPFERAVKEDAGFGSLRAAFYWWNCMLLLAMFPMFWMSIVMLKHNVDFKVWRYSATRPQSRVMLASNLVGMVITWVNVCALVDEQLSRLVRAYYCIDALIYYLMLHLLVLRDSLQAKPKWFSLVMYFATIIYSLVSWLSRMALEFPVEQSTLIDFDWLVGGGGGNGSSGGDGDGDEGSGGRIIVQTLMEAINSSTVVMIGGNFVYVVANVETVCWAPVRLSKHDLQNELYLQKVRRAFQRRLRADLRTGELKAESLDKESERLHRDPAVVEAAVVRIQRRWRSYQADVTFADVVIEMVRLSSGNSSDSLLSAARASGGGGGGGGGGPALAVGTRLRHGKRGVGTVAEQMEDGRVRVVFDSGDEHRYKTSAMHKFSETSSTLPVDGATGTAGDRSGMPLGMPARKAWWRRQRQGWDAVVKMGAKNHVGDRALAPGTDGGVPAPLGSTSNAARAARSARWGTAAGSDPRASIGQQIHDAAELDCGEFVEDEDVELNDLSRQ